MQRPHPYAGYGLPPGGRGRDSPPGPGPDRTRPPVPGRGFPNGPGRVMGGGGGPPAGYGRESPYQGPALDNPYGEDGYNGNFRQPGDEYSQYELSSDPRQDGRFPKREGETKHDPLIEERLQRERPCRTLFIRNIKYETDSSEFRLRFEEFGEIKTFFDLISHRGMVFCTYFDMRAAERAKDRLQGTELAGRPIDVHYSLPRDDQKNELNQGIIIVNLIDSPTRAAIDDVELRRKASAFGDVKSVQPHNGRHDSRTIEFYDLRSAEEANNKLRHQTFQDGALETEFLFMGDALPGPGPAMQERARDRGPRAGRQRAGRGKGGKGGGGGGGGGAGGGGGGYDDRRGRDWGDGRGRASPPRHYEDRWRERSPPPRGRIGSESHADREKMEQAKKVQDLLAALKNNGAPPPPQQQPPGPGYYPPAPPAPSQGAGLPPNLAHIGALLQQALPPQQAQTITAALNQYHAAAPQAGGPLPGSSSYPNMPPSYPHMPPPSSMYQGGPSPQAPYPYPPPGQGNGPPPPGSGYPGAADIYSMLERQKQGGPPPSNPLPPDNSRYYQPGPPPQQFNSPPPPGSSAPATSIQDLMALLKRPA